MNSDIDLDLDAFNQLLSMDDDPSREFTRQILDEMFTQIDDAIPKFRKMFEEDDLDGMAKLGHFIKGSSSGVGAAGISTICEDIQSFKERVKDPRDHRAHLKSCVEKLIIITPKIKKEMEILIR
jgi:HPt (histidine-containing phosphotransfer) domain-containing protein